MDDRASALIDLIQEEQAQLLRLLRELSDRIETLETSTVDPLTAQVEEEEEEDHPGLVYETCQAFVDEFARVVYEAPVVEGTRQVRWCDRWTEHPGVLFTMQALWRSYEEARLRDIDAGNGGQNLLTWSESYFHPAMDRITDPAGPFKLCETSHQPTTRLGDRAPLPSVPWVDEDASRATTSSTSPAPAAPAPHRATPGHGAGLVGPA
jgi:hypothetical protein